MASHLLKHILCDVKVPRSQTPTRRSRIVSNLADDDNRRQNHQQCLNAVCPDNSSKPSLGRTSETGKKQASLSGPV